MISSHQSKRASHPRSRFLMSLSTIASLPSRSAKHGILCRDLVRCGSTTWETTKTMFALVGETPRFVNRQSELSGDGWRKTRSRAVLFSAEEVVQLVQRSLTVIHRRHPPRSQSPNFWRGRIIRDRLQQLPKEPSRRLQLQRLDGVATPFLRQLLLHPLLRLALRLQVSRGHQ